MGAREHPRYSPHALLITIEVKEGAVAPGAPTREWLSSHFLVLEQARILQGSRRHHDWRSHFLVLEQSHILSEGAFGGIGSNFLDWLEQTDTQAAEHGASLSLLDSESVRVTVGHTSLPLPAILHR
jgi:hypothetical protein